jgi:hypothetical protein
MSALSLMIRLTVFVGLIIGSILIVNNLVAPPSFEVHSFIDLAWMALFFR